MNKVFSIVAAALPILIMASLIMLARSMPGYFTNQQYLGGAVFLQILILALWFYEQMFFPLLLITFLWAGMDVPLSGYWTMARWAVLAAGAFVGFVRSMWLGRQRYKSFHLVSLFCVASALVSAIVSALPGFSALKVLSLFLLFLYGAAGARLVLRNPDRFFRGLLLACELSVYATAVCYFALGLEIWGNANSMGAVQGVVTAPLLLWGAFVVAERRLRVRWAVACVVALYLVYFSVTRAALLAAAVAATMLLIGVRRQRLLLQGVLATVCVVGMTAVVFPQHFEDLKTSFIEGVVYKGHATEGLFGSRRTPWQQTTDTIREHPYFGSGFGASINQDKPFGEAGKFSSSSDTNREHGSSYLAIMEWMGLLGIVPFVVLIGLLLIAIARVFVSLRRTGNVAHYAVPIMMVLAAGLTHALFEDWLFAVGYYLTILFWSFAFLLMDLVPRNSESRVLIVHGMRFRFPGKPTAELPAVSRPEVLRTQRHDVNP